MPLMKGRRKKEQRRTSDFGNDFRNSYSLNVSDFEDILHATEYVLSPLLCAVHGFRPWRDSNGQVPHFMQL